jgi:UPF0755 protein
MKRPKKIFLYFILPLVVVAVGFLLSAAYLIARRPLRSLDGEQATLLIRPGQSLREALDALPLRDPHDATRLRWAAALLRLPAVADSVQLRGAYRVTSDMTPLKLMYHVQHRMQSPVRITFNNIRTRGELAERLSQQLMLQEEELLALFRDSAYCRQLDTDTANVVSLFLPDTYEVYWNISAQDLVARMAQEYEHFWTPERRALAQALHLTPAEVSVLGSIAEEETQDRTERGIVARLYWNRLELGMPLQADPTVKFAVGDFTLKRIMHEHLAVDSPYNTYLNTGLPPGPIRLCDKATIDAVLHSAPHTYIYMCAREDFSGLHNFARSYAEHQANARRYHDALNARGIGLGAKP